MAILLRFLLQVAQVDFYNPISQTIVKVTSPLLNPFRKIIPGFKHIDAASLILALILQIALIYALYSMRGIPPSIIPFPVILISSLVALATHILNIYLYSLIVIAIASWIAQGSHNPGLMLLLQLTEPLSSRVRRVIPPLGGLDLSLMVIVIIIYFLKNLLAGIVY